MPRVTHLKAWIDPNIRIPLCQPRSIHWFAHIRVRIESTMPRGNVIVIPTQLTIDGREVPHERVVEEMSGS